VNGFHADHDGAAVRVSPNIGERVGVSAPDMILLHYTGMESGEAAEAWLCNPASQVSAHYLVHEDGGIVQMVPESARAWHAGKSSWHGVTDINSHSIGIEIVNPGHGLGYPPFPKRQIRAVMALCRGITSRHGIRPERILAHSDVAPGRKVDPGEKFPWRVMAREGIGHWVAPARIRTGRVLALQDEGEPVRALQAMLAAYGYGVEITGTFDGSTETVTKAFQMHFRPSLIDGRADRATVETLRRLIAGLPENPLKL
jgi:N-acetylmuramoyl-L-alanine amidase